MVGSETASGPPNWFQLRCHGRTTALQARTLTHPCPDGWWVGAVGNPPPTSGALQRRSTGRKNSTRSTRPCHPPLRRPHPVVSASASLWRSVRARALPRDDSHGDETSGGRAGRSSVTVTPAKATERTTCDSSCNVCDHTGSGRTLLRNRPAPPRWNQLWDGAVWRRGVGGSQVAASTAPPQRRLAVAAVVDLALSKSPRRRQRAFQYQAT